MLFIQVPVIPEMEEITDIRVVAATSISFHLNISSNVLVQILNYDWKHYLAESMDLLWYHGATMSLSL